jgi:hypothetical protein
MHLKKKVRSLRLQAMSSRPQPQPRVNIETLVDATIQLNDPEVAKNPIAIHELDQDAKVSEDHP